MNDLQALAICGLLYILGFCILPKYLVLGLFLFHVVFVPVLFKFSTEFRRKLVFCNFVQWPLNIDFNNPKLYGVKGARNLYIEHNSIVDRCKIKVGLWHILPDSSYKKVKKNRHDRTKNEIMDDELANSNFPIIMYCHGNSNSRAASHRIRLYSRLQEMDFHIVAFDYRGFGDSTDVPLSEEGVVEDALIVYNWILSKIDKPKDKPKVFIWGHSLGTGIASRLVGQLDSLCEEMPNMDLLPLPSALILEAPFNNMADEVKYHPLSILVKWLPYRINFFVTPFEKVENHSFKSDIFLRNVNSLPVLILHAKDDWVVPFHLGVKLYRVLKLYRTSEDAEVSFKAYETNLGLGHKWICDAPDLNDTLKEFCNRH